MILGHTQQFASPEEALEHHGVKGMRWGVTKAKDILFEVAPLTSNENVAFMLSKKASKKFKEEDLPKINAKPEYSGVNTRAKQLKQPTSLVAVQYREEVRIAIDKRLREAAAAEKNASGTRQLKINTSGSRFWTVETTRVKHADDSEDKPIKLKVTFDDDGFLVDIEVVGDEMTQSMIAGADFLEHYGIKGMHWGVRKSDDDGPEGVPKKTNKEAKADAEEFTRAKLFYGEGAGTRRKLIKAKVEAKSKKDELYKKAFDHHVEKTDLAKRSEQAVKERKRTDVKKSVKKTGKGVGHILRGNSQYANTAAAVTVAAGGYARAKGYDKKAMDAGKDFINKYINTK